MAYEHKRKQSSIEMEGLRLPDSSDLECQVLSDLVSNPDMLPTVRSIVTRDMFTNPSRQRTWDILNEMVNKGTTVDISTVGARIERETLMDILNHSPALSSGTMDHCRALVGVSTRRLVFSRAYEMMSRAGDPSVDIPGLMSMPGELVAELSGRSRVGAETETVIDVLNSYEEELQDRAMGTIRKIPTGFTNLNKTIMGGWTGGNLVVMSARPSVGKSAIMLQMALSASRAGFPATVYSLEMPNGDLGQRLMWSTGYVRPGDVASDEAVKSLDWDRVIRATTELCKVPLCFNTKLRTLDEICNDIMLQHQRGRCEIAFIDHLHIMTNTDNRMSAYQAITERTRRLKLLAMDCGIPVILLCQLNRLSDMENRPPDLRDLRDSGSIEQDADIVLMLSRHTGTKTDPLVDMWVRKNRNGKAGDILIGLTGDVQRGFTVFSERKDDNGENDAICGGFPSNGGVYR